MELKDGHLTFFAVYRSTWRDWLVQYHQVETVVYLIIYYKKSKKPSIDYPSAIAEAICFGWIDSKVHNRGPDSYYVKFSPRKNNSKWSASNIRKAERLIKAGLMSEKGMESVKIAQQKGKWLT